MDKDILRMVIIATGLVVIFTLVLRSFFKNKQSRRGIDFYDKGNPLENIDQSLVVSHENDDFEIVPLGSALDEELPDDPITQAVSESESSPDQETESTIPEMPKLIQFSIVSASEEGFNGKKLFETLRHVGLEYGTMKIFERLDDQRRVDYAVASMVEPGTFPETDLEIYDFPGIVFFIQPGELEAPLAVFDEVIQSIDYIATHLDGIKRDQNREILSEETVQALRLSISSHSDL